MYFSKRILDTFFIFSAQISFVFWLLSLY